MRTWMGHPLQQGKAGHNSKQTNTITSFIYHSEWHLYIHMKIYLMYRCMHVPMEQGTQNNWRIITLLVYLYFYLYLPQPELTIYMASIQGVSQQEVTKLVVPWQWGHQPCLHICMAPSVHWDTHLWACKPMRWVRWSTALSDGIRYSSWTLGRKIPHLYAW